MNEQSNIKTVKIGPLGSPQGDVPVIRVQNRTPGGKVTNRLIVAYGEATGHHHEIQGECEVVEVERDFCGQLFKGLEVIVTEEKPGRLYHKSGGEHYTVEFVPGIYFVPTETQQVEYDGAKERRVAD